MIVSLRETEANTPVNIKTVFHCQYSNGRSLFWDFITEAEINQSIGHQKVMMSWFHIDSAKGNSHLWKCSSVIRRYSQNYIAEFSFLRRGVSSTAEWFSVWWSSNTICKIEVWYIAYNVRTMLVACIHRIKQADIRESSTYEWLLSNHSSLWQTPPQSYLRSTLTQF